MNTLRKWKRYSPLAVVLGCLFGMAFPLLTQSRQPQSESQLEQKGTLEKRLNHDFGPVLVGRSQTVELSRVFVVENPLAAPVTLARTAKSCGCVSDVPETLTLAANTLGEISVGFRIPAPEEPLEKVVSVRYESGTPEAIAITLSIRAFIAPRLSVVPQGEREGRTAMLDPMARSPLVLAVVSRALPGDRKGPIRLAPEFERVSSLVLVSREDTGEVVTERYKLEIPYQYVREKCNGDSFQLRISHAGDEYDEHFVWVRDKVGVRPTPETVFARIGTAEQIERSVRLSSDEPFKVLCVEPNVAGLRVNVLQRVRNSYMN